MKIPCCLLLLIGLLAIPLGAQEPPRPMRLPDGAAALVRGEIITMDEFREMLTGRFGNADEGKQALVQLVEKILVTAEQERRGITVSDTELEAYIRKVEKDVVSKSQGTQTLKDLLAQRKISREEFLEVSRDYLVRQKLAGPDLGIRGEVNQAQLSIWIESLKRKRGVLIGGPGLAPGVQARVGSRSLVERDLGQALIENLPRTNLNAALWDLVIARAVDQDLRSRGITITEGDVDASIEDLRKRFEEDPRFKNTNLSFEAYVKAARHTTVADLRRDPLFRSQVGLVKSIRAQITAADVREHWEKNRSRYGEARSFIHLLIKANENPTFGGQGRSYREAKQIIDALYIRCLRGAPFAKLVLESSEDRSATVRPDRIIVANRDTVLPDSLKAKVFSSPQGEVVGPIRTAYGYHLLEVKEIQKAPGFEEIRERIMADLVRERRNRAKREILQDKNILLRY